MNKHRIGALIAAAALTLTFAGTALAAEDTWDGQGWPITDNCEDSDPGTALWIWTGESTDTPVLHFDGNDYQGDQQGNGAWHFVTPYPTSEPTGTTLTYGAGEDGVLTLSHGCPGETTTTEETTTEETTTEETTTEETTSEETTPSGSVEELTPPSTDTIGQPTSSSSVSTGLLLVLAGILATVLVVVPAAARNRR